IINGKVSRIQVEVDWLRSLGYKFQKGAGKSNLSWFHKKWVHPIGSVYHEIHLNGTWTLQISPKRIQTDPRVMVDFADHILNSAIRRGTCSPVVVRRFEASRPDDGAILQWMKSNNIKEIKVYIHDNYEVRVEVVYLDPAFSPRVWRIL